MSALSRDSSTAHPSTTCICLSCQIVLLGVCISPGKRGGDAYEELSLQPMPLYATPSDNVVTTCVASSANGRIFLGGSDGHVYELQYSAQDTWRKRRVAKVGCCAWQRCMCQCSWHKQHDLVEFRPLMC